MHQQVRQTDVLLLPSRQFLICLFPSVQGFANMQLANCENILQVSHHISVSELACLYRPKLKQLVERWYVSLQLQGLMLQMAANGAAPPARPSRTAETSTSTLWAPGAALLQRQPSSFLQSSSLPDSQQQQQQEQPIPLQASLSDAPDSGNGNEPGAQHAQRESQPLSSAAPSEIHAAEDTDAASTESHDQTSVQSQAQGAPCSTVSHSMQQPSQHASHHDAHQPWASQWAQPALPALTVPTAQSRLDMPLGLQQHRRATAADVPVSRTLQQQAMRNSSGLQAARSLSWSQPAAGDSPLADQPSSGKTGSERLHFSCPCKSPLLLQ